MNGAALERVFREASGRIIAALAVRFRDVALAEDAFSESCLRAVRLWPQRGIPDDLAAWLYRIAERVALDALRRNRVRERHVPDTPPPVAEEPMTDEAHVIPDERLRLIFICCHPAVAPEARAALTLRLVCGLTVTEIARAFLVREATLAQRLVRAKRKIAEAGVPFALPAPDLWPERLDAVLSTLEVAYAKAHEDAAGGGPHASFAAEVLHLTKLLAELVPEDGEICALAAQVRYAEARRPARIDGEGVMVPLSAQDPKRWRRDLIDQADALADRAARLAPASPRTLQARLQRAWCARLSLDDAAPWREVLSLYDQLLVLRDDPIVRLNRAVALAEVEDLRVALREVDTLPGATLGEFLPFHAVRADLLRRMGRIEEARAAYDAALALAPPPAEQVWLMRRRDSLPPRGQAPARDGRAAPASG